MWEPLKRRELSDDVSDVEFTPKEVVELLSQFKPGELWEKIFRAVGNNTSKLQGYISALKANGLDIGKGDATFGYKIPLPNGENYRSLQIFRRK